MKKKTDVQIFEQLLKVKQQMFTDNNCKTTTVCVVRKCY